VAVVLVQAVVLRVLGQVWWCKCASWVPWSFDIWSNHNSQHLIDPYSFTHVLHGLVFYAVLAGLLRLRVAPKKLAWRAVIAVVFEAAWEILENTPLVIDRYREATISLDYHGDSIANSVSDVGCCLLGFALAARLPVRASIGSFVATELILLAWIRDSLVLNVIMLVWPIEAIRTWQGG
jgi:hypothetical protein